MLLQQIKEDSIAARKERNPFAPFLVTLYSECANVGKTKANRESTDEEALSIVKKFKAGIVEIISIYQNTTATEELYKALKELELVEKYIPQQLSEVELKTIILSIRDNIILGGGKPNIGLYMKELKANHNGLFDGAQAQTIIKELL
ncbi:MAG: GatB/YqeY domain-containing protein [Bacteroidales bacterium]|jgi:hypothetical protein